MSCTAKSNASSLQNRDRKGAACQLLLRRISHRRLRRLRQNERSLARAQQLKVLPNLHLLLGRAILQLTDAFLLVLVFALQRGVLFLERVDVPPLVEQRRDALRSPQGDEPVYSDNY